MSFVSQSPQQHEKRDARLIMLQPRPREFWTADKKNLRLENAICYRIVDPMLSMKTVRGKNGLEASLIDLLSSLTGLLLGHSELTDIVDTDPKRIESEKMNTELTELMTKDSKNRVIQVESVSIKRIKFPSENRFAVFHRMRAEPERAFPDYCCGSEEQGRRYQRTG